MKCRSFVLLIVIAFLLSFSASLCLADPILEYDLDGNPSLSSQPDSGGSSTINYEESASGGASSSSSGGSNVLASTSEVTQYQTEGGETYSLYQANELFLKKPVCMILIPGDMDEETFMELTEWRFFSGLDGFDAVLLSYDWTEEESAFVYFESVYEEVLHRSDDAPGIYLIGYEEGGDFAALEAATHTTRYSGLVTLGGTGIPKKYLDKLNEENKKQALSVWMFSREKTSNIDDNLDYWTSVNSITGSGLRPYRLRFADELYMPNTSTAGRITSDSDRMGIVLFSRKEEYYNFSITDSIARNFVMQVEPGLVSFHGGITGGELVAISDWHFIYNRCQMKGQQRDYWIFLPDAAFFEPDPSSLLILLHGNGGSGEDMIYQTQWHRLASQHNCIVLYPSSLYMSGTQHYWQNIPEEMTFIRYLIEMVCDRYDIDRSRIYISGFSNGSGMAENLAIRCPDLFAAAVMSAPVFWEKDNYGPINNIHEVAALYSLGTKDEFLDKYDMDAEITGLPATRKMQYWEKLYGFDHDSYEASQKGDFTMYTYRSPNDIPVCHWIRVEGKTHYYAVDEIPAYYEFMSHFTKGTNGELYYDGVQVTSRHTMGETWNEYVGEVY